MINWRWQENLDPVQLPTLLNIIDKLSVSPVPLTVENLNLNRNLTTKHFSGIGRVLEKMGIGLREREYLVPGADLNEFIEIWDQADLLKINTFLCRYPPYDTFIDYLKNEISITVPPTKNSEARHQIGKQLRKEKIRLTFVGIDTFKWWGMAVGQVHVSHIGDRRIYWGGENPSLDFFEKSLVLHYNDIRPLDGFANIGQLGDLVCRDLNISFTYFEKLFIELCSQRKGYTTATSLLRLPTSRLQVQTILPRSQAKQKDGSIEWIEKRFIEDGIIINGRSVKMVKYHPLKSSIGNRIQQNE